MNEHIFWIMQIIAAEVNGGSENFQIPNKQKQNLPKTCHFHFHLFIRSEIAKLTFSISQQTFDFLTTV